MEPLLKVFFCFYLCSGLQAEIRWLPCTFTDERVSLNKDGLLETELIHREAMLQFGGETPVNPGAITFMVTGSKLDLRRHLGNVGEENLECVLRRYSTEGIQVRWPAQGAKGYNRWYSCTLKHGKGLWVTGFLRQASDQPPPGQQDYRNWPAIADQEILTTTVAMMIKTQTPLVKAGLMSKQKLHCQFEVDHRGPNVTVEWHRQHRGERTKLFSHVSRSGQVQGKGVNVKRLADGDASYSFPLVKMSNEGTYVCSVAVVPIFTSVNVELQVEESPRVSINVGAQLVLQEGNEQKIVCEASGYYPLDVEIVWTEQDAESSGRRVGASIPKTLSNVLLSSHKHNKDSTYDLSAFFYLKASLNASGKQFTCIVSHRSLQTPIKKSFILGVEEPSSWMFFLSLSFVLLFLLVVLVLMIQQLNSAKKTL